MARLVVDQLRLLVIVWLLLTLPVVCHHETAVVILTAVAAGHEHQHMMAEATSEAPPTASTAHHHHGTAAGHAESPAATYPAPVALPMPPNGLDATRQPPATLAQWQADQATPVTAGLPAAQDGVAFVTPSGIDAPASAAPQRAGLDAAAPDSQRHAPPAPPPRALLA